MSTLKTNNIEHLDASTPSIQTTIGGGTILAGVSTVSGALNVGTGTSISSPATNTLALGTNNAERLRITSDGSVGIGTFDVDSAVKLQVNAAILMAGNGQGDGQTGIEIGHGGPGVGTAHHRIRTGGGAGQNLIIEGQTAASGGDVIFKTGGTSNRLRITSDGKIGINETSPSAILEVKGTVTAGDGNNEDLQRWNIASNNVKAEIKYIDTAADRGMLFGTTTDHVLAFQINNTERARITSNGLTFNGDTAAANALDDYEEGTWTANLSPNTGTFTSTTEWGKYTKIGNTVYVWFRVVGSNSVSATLSNLTGLPFTVGGMSSQYPGPAISNAYGVNLGSNGTALGGYWMNGQTQLRFHSYGNNTVQLSPSVGTGTVEIRGEGFYTVS